MTAALPKATRRGLGDEAADVVRAAIFSGHFPPGSALREVELAAELGISRGSLRDGLAILGREGLIQGGWHRGSTVIDLHAADAEELYSLRGTLDSLAATTARAHRTDRDLADLDALVTAQRAVSQPDADRREFVALDIAFHDRIYAAAGNGRLTEAWRAIRSQVQLFGLHRAELGGPDHRPRVVTEHHELVCLLRDGDPETTARQATRHVDSARQALLAALARHEPGRPG